MKKNSVLFLALSFFSFLFNVSSAQQYVADKVVIVNGGMFEFSPPYVDYVAVTVYDVVSKEIINSDTIFTQSAQDALIEDQTLYVAAADSIVSYDLRTLTRNASVAFGSSSTIKLATYDNYLLVGNWFGSADNNFRVFDKNTLALVDTIPEITRGAKDFVVVGDSAYIQQNLSSSSFADSAGYLAVVDLTTLTHVRDIALNNAENDLGRLHVSGDMIYGLNSGSNTITSYNTATGASSTSAVGTSVTAGGYGPQTFLWKDTLYFKSAAGIGTYDLNSSSLIDSSFIDSVVTAFAVDTINRLFYTTRTDFASFTRGAIVDFQGNALDTLPVGFAPEVIRVFYDFTIGITSNVPETKMSFYPNPASSVVSIVSDAKSFDIKLYNQSGQLILEERSISGIYSLDISSVPSGVYLLQSTSNSSVAMEKLIIQH